VHNFQSSICDLSESVTLASDLSLSEDSSETATEFPFLTVQNFESRASHVREQGGFPMVFWAPLVQEDQADEWANYTHHNAGWLQESRALNLATESTAKEEDYEEGDFEEFIYESPSDPETGEEIFIRPRYRGPYAPLWMVSPPPRGVDFVNQGTH